MGLRHPPKLADAAREKAIEENQDWMRQLQEEACQGSKCFSRGRHCVYDIPKANVFEPLRSAPAQQRQANIGLSVIYDNDADGLLAFQYYLECIEVESEGLAGLTVVELSALRKSIPMVNEFITALTLVHRAAWDATHNVDDSRRYFATFGRALKAFVTNGVDMHPALVVFCQEKLAMAEVLRSGDIAGASRSLATFRTLLQAWIDERDTSKHPHARDRAEIASRLLPVHIASGQVYGGTAAILGEFKHRSVSVEPADVAAFLRNLQPFPSLHHAMAGLEFLISRWYETFLLWNDSAWVNRLDLEYTNIVLAPWKYSFDAMPDARPHEDHDEWTRMSMHLHYLTAKVGSLKNKLPDAAKHVLYGELADTYDLLLESAEGRARTPLKLGWIPPAFALANECSDPNLRRRGVGFLQTLNISEGDWNSTVAHRIALAMQPVHEALGHSSTASPRADPAHQSPNVAVLDASVTWASHAAEVQVAYSLAVRGKKTQCFTQSTTVPPESLEACRAVDWPLRSVVRSHGYHNLVHTAWAPYLMTSDLSDITTAASDA